MRRLNMRNVKEQKLVVKYVDDGALFSDLYLSVMVWSLVDGVSISRAVKSEGSSRFLFKLDGDPEKIKEFTDWWFSGKKEKIEPRRKEKAEEMGKFQSRVKYLKSLLDNAKVNISDNRGQKVNGG